MKRKGDPSLMKCPQCKGQKVVPTPSMEGVVKCGGCGGHGRVTSRQRVELFKRRKEMVAAARTAGDRVKRPPENRSKKGQQ